MPTRNVKYWKRLDEYRFEPHSTSVKERAAIMSRRDNEAWCHVCKCVVETESKLDATGLVDVCPFCRTEL